MGDHDHPRGDALIMPGRFLIAELARQPWALEPTALGVMADVLGRWAHGTRLDEHAIEAAVGSAPMATRARRQDATDVRAGVAVLPLFGVLAHRAHMVSQVSGAGGTSAELFGRALAEALDNPAVRAIVIDVDSPGGSVSGTLEAAEKIFEGRARKPIIAVANAMAASAAYWIASAATELVVTPSGSVGSIGVLAVHEDRSARNAAQGIKLSFIHAGKYKVEGNSAEPLSADARTEIARMVDQAYAKMTAAIGRYRGRAAADVREHFGQGRMVTALDALKAGMVDRIATLEDTILRASSRRPTMVVVGGQGGPKPSGTPARNAANARLALIDPANSSRARLNDARLKAAIAGDSARTTGTPRLDASKQRVAMAALGISTSRAGKTPARRT